MRGGAGGSGVEQADCEGLVEVQEAGGQGRFGPQEKHLEQGDVLLSADRNFSPLHFFLPHPTGPAKVRSTSPDTRALTVAPAPHLPPISLYMQVYAPSPTLDN